MAWSRTVMTYPPQVRQVFVALMETGHETSHAFNNVHEANYFMRMIAALRFAFLHDKNVDDRYKHEAALYTTEQSEDGLTVRLISTSNTKRAMLAARVLDQQATQFKEAGVLMPGEIPVPKDGSTAG